MAHQSCEEVQHLRINRYHNHTFRFNDCLALYSFLPGENRPIVWIFSWFSVFRKLYDISHLWKLTTFRLIFGQCFEPKMKTIFVIESEFPRMWTSKGHETVSLYGEETRWMEAEPLKESTAEIKPRNSSNLMSRGGIWGQIIYDIDGNPLVKCPVVLQLGSWEILLIIKGHSKLTTFCSEA